jgi:hypothetical protein
MHPSREYIYTGGVYDLGQLFRITSVDDRLAELDAEIAIRIHTQFRILRQPEQPKLLPDVNVGNRCSVNSSTAVTPPRRRTTFRICPEWGSNPSMKFQTPSR